MREEIEQFAIAKVYCAEHDTYASLVYNEAGDLVPMCCHHSSVVVNGP